MNGSDVVVEVGQRKLGSEAGDALPLEFIDERGEAPTAMKGTVGQNDRGHSAHSTRISALEQEIGVVVAQ
ncbi:unannotated protein [freshwater metagenome]|uniref:Unannotated protein n=1 Tax=freshwater metagenome TaxID=449393 RepID=A0A6J5YCW5_9ZZZZ